MTRLPPLLLCTWLLPSFAVADEPESKEQWLVELRNSALESMYPDLVRKVLFVIYDYGYVHAEHEPACAAASKIWADALLEKLGKQIEAHGLPVGKKPE
jgi:LmbE family N-acetylglucosaminyl deacetylase